MIASRPYPSPGAGREVTHNSKIFDVWTFRTRADASSASVFDLRTVADASSAGVFDFRTLESSKNFDVLTLVM